MKATLFAAALWMGTLTNALPQPLSTVQFTSAAYSVSETSGVVVITVERFGEPGATAYVEYSTHDGTAMNLIDYIGQSGHLEFFGETNLTIVIPILDNALAGDETFSISLFNPDPNSTQLGLRTNAVIVISEDGPKHPLQRWHTRTSPANGVRGVAYGSGIFVAVGDNGLIATSSDGVDWFETLSPTTNSLYAITYGKGLFVAVGYPDILTSADGLNWTLNASEPGWFLSDVTCGDGLFVAVGYMTVLTSTDGSTWTQPTNLVNGYLNSVAYGNGIFVVVGYEDHIQTSSDGKSWTLRHTSLNPLNKVTFGKGTFVAVGGHLSFGQAAARGDVFNRNKPDGIPQRNGVVLTSHDGITWAVQDSGTDNGLAGVAFGSGTFVAAGGFHSGRGGNSGIVLTSIDGVLWTRRLTMNRILGNVAHGNASFIVLDYASGITILQSDPLVSLDLRIDASSESRDAELTIFGPINRSYRIELANALASSNAWATLATVSVTNSPQRWTDSQATNSASRFYRAVLLP